MKTKDVVAIASVALGTAALTVVLGLSSAIEAGGDGQALIPKITTPKLMSHGVEITVTAADGHLFQTGEEAVFAVKAVNTTENPVTTKLALVMTGTSPASEMSRVLIMPTILWQQQQECVLQPQETKTITVATQTKLPASKMISVSIKDLAAGPEPASPGIVALSFSTVPSPVHTGSAK